MSEMISKKSYAKVNVFLKISGKRGDYHEIISRFVKVQNLYDTISFEKGNFNEFTLEGDFGCETKKNTIFKAYEELYSMYENLREIFMNYKVVVQKRIPEFAGLGGGSSNAAVFMIMLNEMVNLNLSKDELANIGVKIGADVPFFIYEYDSANVTGIGEKVEKFDEDVLDIQTFTPKIECNTKAIFTEFRKNFYKEISEDDSKKLLSTKSKELFQNINSKEANDLYEPALSIYEDLMPENFNLPKHSFFSGSGSSFFYIK
ncbi:MAG: 4-(cytidine 5'-diphospho)-2-C-methyl-D-erythritol kinase [Campylobacterota bacterium]|nr:4-(cytidine 5'-diphospho)-2-C-methyl-D-erythritol kinase [Campylobacterota bacterium]